MRERETVSIFLSGQVPTKSFRSLARGFAILLLVLLPNLTSVADGASRTDGYITAVLRGECTDAPPSASPVGAIRVGSNYVIMTIGVGDLTNWSMAQQLATDAVFESLVPLYCALSANPETVCYENRVQWSVELYDAAGNPQVSGCAASGCEFHYFNSPCSVSASEHIQFLMKWVSVEVTAGILDLRDGNRLTAMLENALRSALRGSAPATSHKLQALIRELNEAVRTGRLPSTAGATLRNGAMAAISELLSELTKKRDERL
jgi:hypothetical protein